MKFQSHLESETKKNFPFSQKISSGHAKTILLSIMQMKKKTILFVLGTSQHIFFLRSSQLVTRNLRQDLMNKIFKRKRMRVNDATPHICSIKCRSATGLGNFQKSIYDSMVLIKVAKIV